ncbi:hypothetical protein ACGFMO_10370 [Streptomyces niveus]|uniref:DUF7134 domain-containing protein n=1 Tax=Streptomyces niveus TaxID=193462 RepID=UPI003719C0BB
MNRDITFERLLPRVRAVPPITADLLVAAGVALFTASDAAVNDPEYRQADAFTWLLVAVSVLALIARRRRPVPVVLITGAACAGWALYGHIGELLNLPVIVALYTVAVLGDRRRTVWTGAVAAVVSGAVAPRVGHDVANPRGLPVLELIWPLVPLLFGPSRRDRAWPAHRRHHDARLHPRQLPLPHARPLPGTRETAGAAGGQGMGRTAGSRRWPAGRGGRRRGRRRPGARPRPRGPRTHPRPLHVGEVYTALAGESAEYRAESATTGAEAAR